ncbi:MAG TPA: NAD(P)-dependent oxidoreductase [Candidatus Acidoferrum sp.]|nr:NAD(P)-dependent oxidoreductase [Candidatus Acidoferrum sp.]
MKILFTGASSFTGFWFVKTLAAAGHEVVCPVTGNLVDYADLRLWRVEQLKALARFHPLAPFGSENFLKIMREGRFDLLCHHAAEVRNYKSPDFDSLRALQNNTLNLRPVLTALKQRGLKAVCLTGNVCEPDEGAGDEPLRAFSSYGLSKGLTYQVFRHYCQETGVALGKFVIPNPFGPCEEPRFTAYLMRTWREGRCAEVRTPEYVRDNIHVDLLAAVYGQFVQRLGMAPAGFARINPSGYTGSQGEFAQRVAREAQARLGWACELKLGKQEDFSEPLRRVNTEPAAHLVPDWNENAAWDAFVGFYAK